jgi:hypothetical protein
VRTAAASLWQSSPPVIHSLGGLFEGLDSVLIDKFLPTFDIHSRHRVKVTSTPELVFKSIRAVDLTDSALTKILFLVRGLPRPALRLDGLLAMGFIELGEITGQEYLLGIVGQFWKPSGALMRVPAEEFEGFRLDGYSKAVWNFATSAVDNDRCELATETRVATYGRSASMFFRLYWMLVGPFSGVIRREALRSIKNRAEAGLIHESA